MSYRNSLTAEMVGDEQFRGDLKHRFVELIHRVCFDVKPDDVAL